MSTSVVCVDSKCGYQKQCKKHIQNNNLENKKSVKCIPTLRIPGTDPKDSCFTPIK
jgi:hypothetical protein